MNPAVQNTYRGPHGSRFSRAAWTAARDILRVAEKIASDQLDPALRSRGGQPKEAEKLLSDDEFLLDMQALFSGDHSGMLDIPLCKTRWNVLLT